MTFTFKGEIVYELRDAETLELQETHTQSNALTEHFFHKLLNNPRLRKFRPAIQGKAMPKSRWNWQIPNTNDGNVCRAPDSFVATVGQWFEFFTGDATNPPFFQYNGRFQPPSGSSRTINTIILTEDGTDNSGFYFSNGQQGADTGTDYGSIAAKSFAYSRLNVPCVQTTTQVLDIYYRVYCPVGLNGSVPIHILNEWVARGQGDDTALAFPNSHLTYHTVWAFRFPTPKSGDEGVNMAPSIAHALSRSYENTYYYPNNFNPEWSTLAAPVSEFGKRFLNKDHAFAEYAGRLFGAIISGGTTTGTSVSAPTPNNSQETGPIPLVFSNLPAVKKIHNLIGHGTTVGKTRQSSLWLDVDNLASGSGVVQLGGTWNNHGTPNGAGLYYASRLPEFNRIVITGSGGVGTATYKYVRQPYFGLTKKTGYSDNLYSARLVPALCATSTASVTSIPNGFSLRRYAFDEGKGLLGDTSASKFDTQQITSSCSYDDSSVIVVKKDMILLYNAAAPDYWKLSGGFTNASQVAVVDGKIYIACRDTGLYVVDPRFSLTVTKLNITTNGIDMSKCYGVAAGFGNSVWAVVANGLVSLIGSTWSLYNESSSPALALPGITDNNWQFVEYLKVDKLSTDYQLALIRSRFATVDANRICVWWSMTTAASNGPVSNPHSSRGNPRVARNHFGGEGSLWAMFDAGIKVMAFGGTSFTLVSGSTYGDALITDILGSILFVKNQAGATRLLTFTTSGNMPLSSGPSPQSAQEPNYDGTYLMNMHLVDETGAIVETSNEVGPLFPNSFSVFNISTSDVQANRGSVVTNDVYSKYDRGTTFMVGKAMFHIGTRWVNSGTVDPFRMEYTVAAFMSFARNFTPAGGPLAYLTETQYGWSGSAWVEGAAGSRVVHSTAENLLDGVTVQFTNGASGTSFVDPNYYSFVLYEGHAQDNATRFNLQMSYYSRRVLKSTSFNPASVPALTAGPTGIVGAHAQKRSEFVSVVDNQITFGGEGGIQYAVGDKYVCGDFEIDYTVADLTTGNLTNRGVECGVGKESYGVTNPLYGGRPQFGFIIKDGSLYAYQQQFNLYNGQNLTSQFGISLASVTSLRIRRVSGILELLVNNVVRLTNDSSLSKINLGDQRLELIFATGRLSSPQYMVAGLRMPVATITSNGSDNAVYVGNGVNNVGQGPRFCTIDGSTRGLNSVALAGVPAVLKYDGTLPAAGEVVCDPYLGVLYFNPSDEGKMISGSFTYQMSEDL